MRNPLDCVFIGSHAGNLRPIPDTIWIGISKEGAMRMKWKSTASLLLGLVAFSASACLAQTDVAASLYGAFMAIVRAPWQGMSTVDPCPIHSG